MAVTQNALLEQNKAPVQQTVPGSAPAQANQTAPVSAYSGTGTVSYIDNSGEKQTGVANTASPGYYDAMREFYDTMYNDQVAANNQALENARTRAQEATDAQLAALQAGYQGTNRQLYRDYMDNQRKLPQQMAAQGYTGGLSESGRLRLQNAYQENLAGNERSRLSDVSGANQALAQQLYQAQAAADAANQQAAQNRYSYLAALRESQYQDLQSRAAMMATAGDFSVYLELGYSQAEVDALTRAWLAQNPGLLSAWITAHPAEASRMGISLSSDGGSSKRYYGGSSKKEEGLKLNTDGLGKGEGGLGKESTAQKFGSGWRV